MATIGYTIDELSVGMSESLSKTITEADILLFSAVSCDTNPMHIDETFAKSTRFGGRIAHGMLTASLFSGVLGNKLPGMGTIYLRQDLKFTAPVKVGDTATATVTVREIIREKNRVILDTIAKVGDTVVIEGTAEVMAPKKPKDTLKN